MDFRFKPWGQEPVTDKDRAKIEIMETIEPLQGGDEVIVVDPDSGWLDLVSANKEKWEKAEAKIICGGSGSGRKRYAFERLLGGSSPTKTKPEVAIQFIEEAVKKERGKGMEQWERENVMRCLQAMHEKYNREIDI